MNWRVFLPGLIMLAVGWLPLVILPFLLSPFHVDLMGFGMGWGLVITLPLTVVGGMALVGGVGAFILGALRR